MSTNLEQLRVIGPRVHTDLLALEATDLTTEQRDLVDRLHRDALRTVFIAADEFGVEVEEFLDGDTLAQRGGNDKEKPGDEPGPGGEG